MNYVSSLVACLKDIKDWKDENFLPLSETRTDVVLSGPSQLLDSFSSFPSLLQANICTRVY